METKWLIRVHKWLLPLLILSVFIPFYKAYRWQPFLLALVFITGIWLCFTVLRRVKTWKKIYLLLYPVYTALALFAFMADKIFFIIVMIPFWIFILPQDTYVTSGKYEIRSNKTIMGYAQAELYWSNRIFEKHIGTINGMDPLAAKSWPAFKVIDTAGKEAYVVIPIPGQDSVYTIEK